MSRSHTSSRTNTGALMMKILVVDDNIEIRETIGFTVRPKVYNVQ